MFLCDLETSTMRKRRSQLGCHSTGEKRREKKREMGFFLGAMLLLHLLLDVVTPMTQAFTIRLTTHLHISGKLHSVVVNNYYHFNL